MKNNDIKTIRQQLESKKEYYKYYQYRLAIINTVDSIYPMPKTPYLDAVDHKNNYI